MKTAVDQSLSPRQARALAAVGDLLVPGATGLPPFSASLAARNLPRMLASLPPADAGGLKLLLSLLGLLPAAVRRALLVRVLGYRGPALALRTLQFGLRGLAYGLYYGDAEVCAQLGYELSHERGTDTKKHPA